VINIGLKLMVLVIFVIGVSDASAFAPNQAGFAETMVFDFLPPQDHGLSHAVTDQKRPPP
jgi:hypothetical protein